MRKFLFIGFLFLSIISVSIHETQAQGNKINLSKNTEEVDGQTYFLHKVAAGQTLYGLAKAYGVTQSDIINNNPEAKNGLQIGQILRIPKIEAGVDMSATPKDTIPPAEFGFIFHQVSAGETLYRIMKKYKVTLNNLKTYNPNLSTNLQIGQWIKIPTDDIIIQNQAENLYDSLITYTLKKRDNYYRLNKKFHITQAAIEQLNPQIKEIGLQKGIALKLPYYKGKPEETPNTLIEILDEPILPPTDSILQNNLGCDTTSAKLKTYRIALMMPFYSNLEPTIRTDNKYFMKKQSTYQSFRYIHYYEGFLMAVDSLEKLGFHAEIYVYDTKADSNVIKKLILKPEFSTLNLIIGPFYKRNIAIVAKAANKLNISIVSPFSNEIGVGNYPNLFIPTASHYTEMSQSIKFLSDSLSHAKIMIIHNGKAKELSDAAFLKNLIKKYSINGNLDTNNLHLYNYKTGGFDKLKADLNQNGQNVIFNLVDNEAYISNFVSHLSQLKDNYNIILMGSEDQWKTFKTLENEYLVNLHLTLSSTGFVDYRQAKVQEFTHLFYDKYKTDPNIMAFKGFDQGFYFMSLMLNFGVNFTPCMGKLKINSLQNSYEYHKTANGCWSNSYANIYQYLDFQLVDKKRDLVPFQLKPQDKDDAIKNEKPANQEKK